MNILFYIMRQTLLFLTAEIVCFLIARAISILSLNPIGRIAVPGMIIRLQTHKYQNKKLKLGNMPS